MVRSKLFSLTVQPGQQAFGIKRYTLKHSGDMQEKICKCPSGGPESRFGMREQRQVCALQRSFRHTKSKLRQCPAIRVFGLIISEHHAQQQV